MESKRAGTARVVLSVTWPGLILLALLSAVLLTFLLRADAPEPLVGATFFYYEAVLILPVRWLLLVLAAWLLWGALAARDVTRNQKRIILGVDTAALLAFAASEIAVFGPRL